MKKNVFFSGMSGAAFTLAIALAFTLAFALTALGCDMPTGATKYTVTFNADGGTVDPSTKTVESGKTASPLPTPTKDGNTFGGWHTERNGGGTAFTDTTPVVADITVYAKWTADPPRQYTVTFDAKGGAVDPSSKIVESGKTASPLPEPTKDGSVFWAWYSKDGTSGAAWGIPFTTETVVNSDITVYARWGASEPTRHTVTFNADGGTVNPSSKPVIDGDPPGILPRPTKPGYTFGGWHTEPNGGGTAFTDTTPVAAPIMVYAKWTKNGVIAIDALQTNLSGRPANTAAGSYTVELDAFTLSYDDNNTTSNWAKVNTAVANAQRYVILDLSNCTFTSDTVYGSYDGDTGMNIIKDNSYIKGVVLPEDITSIGNYAFRDCIALTGITIPAGVTTIGPYAFDGCSALASITIPAGVTDIAYNTFSGCSALTGITIPENVTTIGSSAFSGCSALTGITIPAGVTSIGDSAFSGCSALTGITIPENVTSIGGYVFAYTALTDISIPAGVTTIAEGAFYNCTSLASITIPANVASIGDYAFYGCTDLLSVTFESGSIDLFGDGAFPGGNNLRAAYMADGVGTYTRTEGGSVWTKQL
jgi:uncharacterized repeat protein (TIGR02543 family)